MKYGTSIKLNEHGDFEFSKESNSLAIAKGADNLEQALWVLLSVVQGELRLYPTFGLNVYDIVGTDLPDAFVSHAIRSAVMRDPRVKAVNEIVLKRDGRALVVNVNISTLENVSLDIRGDIIW